MRDDQRIYVACLAAYNNGILHGLWINASEDTAEMQEQIDLMLLASPIADAEEWAIHDHEGLGDLREYAGLAEVAKRVAIADAAEVWGLPARVVIEAMSDHGADDAEDFLSDHYAGRAYSWAIFAEEWSREVYDLREVPDWLQNHIDWASIGRDWELGGEWNSVRCDGEIFFFHNR